MRTLAVFNRKGGIARTTSAVNLAAALGELVLVDLDVQGGASSWLGVGNVSRGLFEVSADHVKLAELLVATTPLCQHG